MQQSGPGPKRCLKGPFSSKGQENSGVGEGNGLSFLQLLTGQNVCPSCPLFPELLANEAGFKRTLCPNEQDPIFHGAVPTAGPARWEVR